jgi:pSer/pThr/pTyr-binding forkhead associated (FHA) protein
MFKLVIQDDEGKTTVVPLIRDEITIGRKEGNTIRLTERNVSRRHARILRNNGEVHIEDLGSYNGIRVNNARIAERVSLRVSDQVQIGDYKLYLKAEGVEQVDDARTMPIERVGVEAPTQPHVAPTDVLPAVTPPAPTAPMPVPQQIPVTPAPATQAPRVVGDPNRTLVAVADTDPHGRPLASAAAVAALAAPVGYGKLVVLSSNFAGKEFELSRPQMIVGRTDENDLVINHRSISRNHAKLVRETDTGRYTISDLQSSNGVRVNGQDYGKVELRRGDVVDLGHVRLRFVEPGEDFVFARDAVITDVPDAGNKRTLLVAILLGALVLAAVGVYMGVIRDSGPKVVTNGSNSLADPPADAGPAIAIVTDATENQNPPLTADATKSGTNTADPERERLNMECLSHQTNKKWVDLEDCGRALGKFDPQLGKSFIEKASMETRADVANRKVQDELNVKDFKTARLHLKGITDKSVYYKEALASLTKAEKDFAESTISDLRGLTKDCGRFNQRLRQLETQFGKTLDDVRSRIKCEKEPPPPQKTCEVTGCASGQKCGDDGKCRAVVVVKPPCDADAEKARGDSNVAQGNHAAALSAFEASLKCKSDMYVLQLAYMAACNSRNVSKAKGLFSSLPAAKQNSLTQICLRQGIDPRP